MQNDLLEMKNITKVYPNGVIANDNINFSIRQGEIHALMGENGAGKSTLMKILFGIEEMDEGEILLRGKKININSPSIAMKYGIGMVHQHFMLIPSLTVAENMILGSEPKKGIFIDKKRAWEETKKLCDKYKLILDPDAKVFELSVGVKQKVEILKALLRGVEILILDEPTAVLTPQETKELFEELEILKKQGHTIIFISHKLKEIKQICDRISIMRNGRFMGVYDLKDISEKDISRLMVGRDVVLEVEKEPCVNTEDVLKVRGLTYIDKTKKKVVDNISFNVKKGQILGIAGVEGNGQKQIVEMITGMRKVHDGKVYLRDEDITGLDIRSVREKGVSYVPEDRMVHGVASDMNIEQNLIGDRYYKRDFNKGFLMSKDKISDISLRLIKDFKIKCASSKDKVGGLSGGNIQKVVVAREFSSNPYLIVVNQPTRGVDVGAIEFIRKELVRLRHEGKGILMVSADLNEVLELSDSLIVVYDGKIAAYFEDASKVTEEELGYYMLGLKRQSEEQIGGAIHEK
ncbi:simple sugar transport system ATP-binding protein [Hathewaya proteolytica DSM 3090]|uniref:Simple sugar transport system ATP-binding protein n=1 Tax=Hathewaya proteolytica DSM 3090 TaxID=1121331 RepID=A0A1M6R5E4_9CLOT|nr:ABC transporter ATP-binding protein [Hathewaya proteolytica]SHK27705.1 simple sugar transport system ATP-binding protein [Hathewaya proteolytica DSM 3090]